MYLHNVQFLSFHKIYTFQGLKLYAWREFCYMYDVSFVCETGSTAVKRLSMREKWRGDHIV